MVLRSGLFTRSATEVCKITFTHFFRGFVNILFHSAQPRFLFSVSFLASLRPRIRGPNCDFFFFFFFFPRPFVPSRRPGDTSTPLGGPSLRPGARVGRRLAASFFRVRCHFWRRHVLKTAGETARRPPHALSTWVMDASLAPSLAPSPPLTPSLSLSEGFAKHKQI